MQGTHMVPLASVPSEFEGRVLVAKLGSAGILAELRGVSRVYPSLTTPPVVWVEDVAEGEARELITTDVGMELEAEPAEHGNPPSRLQVLRPLLVAVALVLLGTFALGLHGCGPSAAAPTSAGAR